VSAFTVFELLIKPFLYKMMGHDFTPPGIMLPLPRTVSRKDTERMSWIPVKIAHDGKLQAVDYHGSAHIDALCHADGLIGMDIGVAEIQKDTVVHTRLI
jgi:molybdopterin molybdotransferase